MSVLVECGVLCYQGVCDYLAVGPYTRCIPSRPSLPHGCSERHMLALPHEPSTHAAIQWFLFANDIDLKSVLSARVCYRYESN